MISAWARMCKIIGDGFVRYLPVVMGPLIQAASLKPEIAFVDCEWNHVGVVLHLPGGGVREGRSGKWWIEEWRISWLVDPS